MPEALVELLPLALLFFALALVSSSQAIVKAIFDPLIAVVGKIPFLGDAIGSALSAMAQAIDNALGTAYNKIDALIGKSWHLLAEQMNWLWEEIQRHANLLEIASPLIAELVNAYHAIRSLAHTAAHEISHVGGLLRTLEQEFHGIEHRVKTLEREIAHGIGHDLRIGLKKTEKEVAHLENDVIPAIRTAEADAANAISNLYDWVRGKADIIGAGTLAAAVTAALAVIGNGWLACKENPFSKSKNPCGLWADLAQFLPLIGLLAIAFDFPEFVNAAETVAEAIGGAVGGIEGTFALSLPPLPPPE